MVDITLSTLFYAVVGLLYKCGGRRERHLFTINAAVFLGGTLAAAVLGIALQDLALDRKAVLWGAAAGLASVTANLTFLLAVRTGRLAPSWTLFSLALIVPVALAAAFWQESLNLWRGAGVLLAFGALLFLGMDMRTGATRDRSGKDSTCGDT
jgi:uncharacterized membrane protein